MPADYYGGRRAASRTCAASQVETHVLPADLKWRRSGTGAAGRAAEIHVAAGRLPRLGVGAMPGPGLRLPAASLILKALHKAGVLVPELKLSQYRTFLTLKYRRNCHTLKSDL